MGKKDFSRTVYQPVKSQLAAAGKELTIKVSHFSDRFDATKDFAGVIVYHWEGQVQWYNNKIDQRGRSFYVYLVCTDNFGEDELREAGQGRVHHTAVERIMGIDFRENKACLGGFSVRHNATHYSSVWLNEKTNTSFALPWESDGSKYLSEGEKLLVDVAVNAWKARGTDIVVTIPSEIDRRLSGGGPGIHRPSPGPLPVPVPFAPPGRNPAGTVPIGSWRECSEGERVRVLPADQAEGPTRRSSANWTSDCRAHCDEEATITLVDSDGTLKLLFDDGNTLWFATGSCVKVTGHPSTRPTPHGGQAHRWSASQSSPDYSTNTGPFRHPGSWTGCGGNPNGTARSSGSGNCSGACRNCGASTHWTCCASTDASSKHCRPGISEEQAERNARLCRGESARALSPSRSSSPQGREGLGHLLGGHLLGMLHQGLVEHLQDAQARARPRSNGVGGIPVGAWVRVKPSVQSPEFGWGGISHQSIGRVEVVDGDILRIRIPGRPNRWNGRVHEMELAPNHEVPTVPTGMVAGAWVRVKPSVQSPRYKWGGVSRGSVGCIRRVDSDGDLWISFQEAKNWRGRAEEMEVVPEYRGPTESGGFRVGARVRLQNGVRPRYGQGGVSSGSVGTVKSITPDGDLHIDFPEQQGWHGHPADLQHA